MGLTQPQIDKAQDESIIWFKANVIEPMNATEAENKAIYSKNYHILLPMDVPAVGSYPQLKEGELRWCLYHMQMADYMNRQVPANDQDTDIIAKTNSEYFTGAALQQYSAFIDDVNLRCPKGRMYLENDEHKVKAETNDAIFQNFIALQAQKEMRKWHSRFFFRD